MYKCQLIVNRFSIFNKFVVGRVIIPKTSESVYSALSYFKEKRYLNIYYYYYYYY